MVRASVLTTEQVLRQRRNLLNLLNCFTVDCTGFGHPALSSGNAFGRTARAPLRSVNIEQRFAKPSRGLASPGKVTGEESYITIPGRSADEALIHWMGASFYFVYVANESGSILRRRLNLRVLRVDELVGVCVFCNPSWYCSCTQRLAN